jgi:hypothetical protein
VVTPDWFGETALGSSLHLTKARLDSLYPSSCFDMLKIFILFFIFMAHFLLVKNTYKKPYSLKAVNYTKLAMAAIECKVAMVISKLVKFELLLELKIEQKHGTSLHTTRCKDATSFKTVERLSVTIILGEYQTQLCSELARGYLV